jgi:hypothetical protein
MTDDAALAADEHSIRDTCMRYWAGFDRGDLELYLSAFTADATMSLFGGEQTMSVADLAARGFASPSGYRSHAPGSQAISVDGDRATADTFVVSHIVPENGPILVRGLRYVEDLVRTGDGWRIQHLQHFQLWQYDMERVEPHL